MRVEYHPRGVGARATPARRRPGPWASATSSWKCVGDVVVGGDGGGDAVAGGAGDLAGAVLADVAGGEEAGERRLHPLVDDDVAGRVARHEIADEVGVGVVADEDEHGRRRPSCSLRRSRRCAASATATCSSPTISSTTVFQMNVHLRVGEGALLEDGAGPQLVAAVDDRGLRDVARDVKRPSSMAASPPPTTTTGMSLKNAASQVAQ